MWSTLFLISPTDSNIMKKTGRILIVAELAREYGFKDVGGLCLSSFIYQYEYLGG